MMSRIVFLSFVIVLVGGMSFNSHAQESAVSGKRRIVILPVCYSPHFKITFKGKNYDREIKIGENVIINVYNKGEVKLQNVSLTNSVITEFVNSRKFHVLDRDDVDKLVDEIDFGDSEYGDKEKTVKAGKMLNADYVLTAGVENIYLDEEVKTVPYLDVKKFRFVCRVDMNYKITEVKTSKIVCSNDRLTVSTDYKLGKREKLTATVFKDLVKESYRNVSRQLLEASIDAVYPIKVVAFDNGLVYVNRGENVLNKGDELTVFSTGKKLVDPDTGESLGVTESKLGEIVITEVKPKVSVGRIKDGKGFAPKPGDICRETEASETKRTTTDNVKTPINF